MFKTMLLFIVSNLYGSRQSRDKAAIAKQDQILDELTVFPIYMDPDRVGTSY